MESRHRVKNGLEFETIFQANPKKGSAYRFRSTRLNGRRAPKVILCDDARIQPGQRCRVRVTSIKKPSAVDRGHIEVEFRERDMLTLDGHFYVPPMLARKLHVLLDQGRNPLLDGPQGSGKTVLSEHLARVLNMTYVFFNCSPVYEATDFLATLQVRATESGQPETVWTPTDILRALEAAHANPRQRFLVFLDEFNRCREMARNGIMPALDATRRLFNPLTGTIIGIPDNVQWIAAINNGAQFTGATNVDPAQLDRFAPVKMSYPPAEEEGRLLCERYPKLPMSQLFRIVRAANAIRKGGLDLSMRATDEACSLMAHPAFRGSDGDALPDVLKTSFCGRFAGSTNDASSDAGVAWQAIVQSLELQGRKNGR